MTTVADQIASELKKAGVEFMFGIPGGPTIPLMEALKKVGIEFILVSNEASGGIMADVVGRLTGIPGVCHATFGPGVTNLSTGIGGALLDRSPLISFTSEQPDALLERTVQMQFDQQEMLKPLTKWTTRLTRENCVETIRKALSLAAAEVSGPVNIALPSDLCSQPAIVSQVDFYSEETNKISKLDPAVMSNACARLQEAKRPLLALGLSAARLCTEDQILNLVNTLGIPVVLTPMAKGLLPEDHPCYAGVLFHAKSDMVADIYSKADLVVGFGYDPIEFNYESWMPEVPIIHFDTVTVDIDPEYTIAGDIVCDLSTSLEQLLTLGKLDTIWDMAQVVDNREAMFEAIYKERKEFSPVEVLKALREALPENGIMTCDVGAHTHLIGQMWKTPGRGLQLMTNGWSAMGFGIPAAIGAKLCKPNVPVVCVTGDGGFLMNCGELITARRYGVNVVFVVLTDAELSLIKVKQRWKEVEPYAIALHDGEFFDAEKFLGVPILTAVNKEQLADVFSKALSHDGPIIVDAQIDGLVYQELTAKSHK